MWPNNDNNDGESMTSDTNPSGAADEGGAFQWRLHDGWGYGWALVASPEADLRQAAAEAVQRGDLVLQWRLEGDLHWESPGADGPVPDVRVLSHRQIAALGARHQRQPKAGSQRRSSPTAEEYPKDYITQAVLSGAVPSLCDLQIGLHALSIYMLGLLEQPNPAQSAFLCTEPEAFAHHCDALIEQLHATAVDYRLAAARTRAADGDQ